MPMGGGRAPLSRGLLVEPPTCTPSLLGFFPSKNEFREVSGQLDSVWFSFSTILKNKDKTETGTGLWVNRLVPKMI